MKQIKIITATLAFATLAFAINAAPKEFGPIIDRAELLATNTIVNGRIDALTNTIAMAVTTNATGTIQANIAFQSDTDAKKLYFETGTEGATIKTDNIIINMLNGYVWIKNTAYKPETPEKGLIISDGTTDFPVATITNVITEINKKYDNSIHLIKKADGSYYIFDPNN